MSIDSTPPEAPVETHPAGASGAHSAFAPLTQALGPAGANAWLARLMDGGTPDLAAQVALSAALGPEQSLRVQGVLASTLTAPQRAALEGVGLDPGRHGPAFDVFMQQRGSRASAFLAAVQAGDVQGVVDTAASAYAVSRA